MDQAKIEKAVGIDADIAKHMMAGKTAAANSAMSLLRIQCNAYDPGGFVMLKDAVAKCKSEIAARSAHGDQR